MLVFSSPYLCVVRSSRLLASVFCLFLLSGAAAPVFAGTDFGAVAVGASSSPVAVTLTFPVSPPNPTVGSIRVVTQGTNGLDFQQAAGGTCAAGTTYAPGRSCTVNVVFLPKGVGLRTGAVLLYDNAATPNLLATTFLSGIGNGGLLNFLGGQVPIGSGLSSALAVTVDAAGNVYIMDSVASSVVKVSAAGGTQTSIPISGPGNPNGIAVDGAGNIYFTIQNSVLEIPFGSAVPIGLNVGPSGVFGPGSLSIGGDGNLYVADTGDGIILKVPPGGGSSTVAANLSGLFQPLNVAVDGNGNIYIADTSNNRVVEIPSGCGSAACQKTVGTGLNSPEQVTLDAAGNIYIPDTGNNRVVVVPVGGGTQMTVGTGLIAPVGVAVDGAGNLYIAGNKVVEKVLQTALGFTLDLGTATVGGPTVANSVFFSNIGNIPVTLSSAGVTSPFTEFNSCGGLLAVGAPCTVTVNFSPTSGGPSPGTSVTGTLTLTNSAPNSPQSIPLTARAIQVPTQLAFATLPGTIVQSGTPNPVTVDVEDSLGRVFPSSSAVITLTVTGPSGYSQSYTQTTTAGSTTFNFFLFPPFSVPGTYAYTATSTGLINATATETVLPSAYTIMPQPVGVESAVTTVTLAFSTSAQLGPIKVVTQGTQGLDFQQATASGGTCAVGTLYVPGQSCTVNVVFTPKGIGQRLGAVVLYDNASTPNLLAQAFISGIGNGGLLKFATVQTTVGSGLESQGVAVDGAGNVYIADSQNSTVTKVPAGGGASTTIGSGLSFPTGVAVDGAGNIYIADQGNNRIAVVPAGGGPQTTTGTGLSSPNAVAVDLAGNVYVADNTKVVEVPVGGGGQTTIGTGVNAPMGVAVDGAGNVYIASSGNAIVVKVPPGGGTQTSIGTGLEEPVGVAVDGAGNVYIADFDLNEVIEVPADGSAQTIAAHLGSTVGVAVDGAGNIYVADRQDVIEVQQTQLPSTVSLGSATVGGAPAANSLSFTNIGNATLTLSSVVSPSQYKESDTCGGTVPVNASCALNLTFTPSTGTASPGTTVPGTLTVTDNAPNSPQAISLTASAIAIPPTITIQPAGQTINSGQTATLTVVATGTPPLTYQWYTGTSPSTVAPISGATNVSFTTPALTANTNYWVRVSNTAGSVNSNTITIPVITPPTITTQPASQTINSGQTATLTVVATGTPPFTYQWYTGTSPSTVAPVSGATNTSFTTPALTANTNYWVRVSNTGGTANSNTATITVITLPTITTQPASQAINSGQTATLTVAAAIGTPPFTYQWYAGTSPSTVAPVSGATNASFTTPALTANTNYWVRVSNTVGSANSNTASITINPLPGITIQPASQIISSGQDAMLTVAATGTAPLSYQWYTGASPNTGAPISGATNASFTTPALITTTSYWVQVKNAAGLTNSNTATITVGPTCTIATQLGNTTLTVIATVTCTASQGATLVSTTIDWGDGTGISTFTGTTPSHTFSTAKTYNVSVSAMDSAALTGTASTSIVLLPLPATAVFSGLSSTNSAIVAPLPINTPPILAVFGCANVSVMINGVLTLQPAATYGITCSSPQFTISSLSSGGANQSVQITIQTTGSGVSTSLLKTRLNRSLWYALALPGPGFLFLGFGGFTRGRGRQRGRQWLSIGMLSLLLFGAVSCGGHFTPPVTSGSGGGANPQVATPAGTYYVIVADTPVSGSLTGFPQTSLIVPLPVVSGSH